MSEIPEVVVSLKFDQEKVHSRRYKEVPVGGKQRLGTLYVPRETLAVIGNPDTLEVTIKAQQD